MSEVWIKAHVDMLTDAKLGRMSPAQRWMWVGLLLLCKTQDPPGTWKPSAPNRTAADLSLILRLDPTIEGEGIEEVETALDYMVSVGMLSRDVTLGAVTVTNWQSRQGRKKPSDARDKVAARQRKSRASRMSRDVTLLSHPVTPRSDRLDKSRGDTTPSMSPPNGNGEGQRPPTASPPTYVQNCPPCAATIRLLNELTASTFNAPGRSGEWMHQAHETYGFEQVTEAIRRQAVKLDGNPNRRRFMSPSVLFKPENWDTTVNDKVELTPEERQKAKEKAEVRRFLREQGVIK